MWLKIAFKKFFFFFSLPRDLNLEKSCSADCLPASPYRDPASPQGRLDSVCSPMVRGREAIRYCTSLSVTQDVVI